MQPQQESDKEEFSTSLASEMGTLGLPEIRPSSPLEMRTSPPPDTTPLALTTESPALTTESFPASSVAEQPSNEDLEDGEIEDDDDEPATTTDVQQTTELETQPNPAFNTKFPLNETKPILNTRVNRFDRTERHNIRYDERKRGHLTEAEKSVMHLHKIERLERLEREKRERFKREQAAVTDDFAITIEKAIANVLKKDKKHISEDEKEEEDKRGKKRKKKDKNKKKKQQKTSPKPEYVDESEVMNIRKGSPDIKNPLKDRTRSSSPRSDYDSYDSTSSSDRSREDRKDWKRDHGNKNSKSRIKDQSHGGTRNRDKSKEQKTDGYKDGKEPICLFYVQGKCNKGEDCPYSHDINLPVKLELCKFYLMDCCAKRDKCLYMHSEFPCKFYHTGLRCQAGDSCKFAHGKPLQEGFKQILFKHIETAPKEILGDFPRLSREGALNMIHQAQKALEIKYSANDKKDTSGSEMSSNRTIIPSLFELNIPVPSELLSKDSDSAKDKEKSDKPQGRERNRPSRWQDPDPKEATNLQEQQNQLSMAFGFKGFYSECTDRDMRVNSNGDIDMRTLPPQLNPLLQPPLVSSIGENSPKVDINQYMRDAGLLQDKPKIDIDIRIRPQDVDIRTIPQDTDIRQLNLDNKVNVALDVDIRQIPQFENHMSHISSNDNDYDTAAEESNLEIDMGEDPLNQKLENDSNNSAANIDTASGNKNTDSRSVSDLPANLPKMQRELFLRIQAQQKENVPENQKEASDEDRNIDWYSDDDDDDDCRLTIKDDAEDSKLQKSEESSESFIVQPAPIKPVEVIEKLGDLSKIDISEEVTKLLSSISRGNITKETKSEVPKDPRLTSQPADGPQKQSSVTGDPRRVRHASTENKSFEKLSIYEQGSISIENATKDVDLRNKEQDTDLRPKFGDTDLRPSSCRPDIDLRQLNLPFKAIQNYTPASEIDASINSHGPMVWKVYIVDIPRPDYSGLKLNAHDAHTSGDPRLKKIFKLSLEEKESPASPKENIKSTPTIRVDPRRRREEKSTDPTQMSYAQQLNILQQSPFYLSLTSSQKLLLNQELATKTDHASSNDQTLLNGILANLGLIANNPAANAIITNKNSVGNSSALNILANINNMNPMMQQTQLIQSTGLIAQNQPTGFVAPSVNPNILQQNPNIVNQMAQSIVQPGLLGAAPGVPNLAPEFQLNFDPRQGGLLGNAPPIQYNDNNYNYNEDYYEGNNFVESGGGGRNSGHGGSAGNSGRGGFRDRQRRGRNFNRNNGGRGFRTRNRNNRSRTPPQ